MAERARMNKCERCEKQFPEGAWGVHTCSPKKYKCGKCGVTPVYEQGICCTPCFDKLWARPSIAVEQELDDDDPEEEEDE